MSSQGELQVKILPKKAAVTVLFIHHKQMSLREHKELCFITCVTNKDFERRKSPLS